MKQLPVFLAALSIAAACNKNIETPVAEQTPSEYGTLEFQITPAAVVETKTITPYTASKGYETQVNIVQVLVFDDSGKINYYYKGSSLSGSFSTVTGPKTVYAVINGPDLSTTDSKSSFESRLFHISYNSIDQGVGFVMYGSGTCNVGGTTTASCNITAKRMLSRIALVKITNNLPPSYGTARLSHVFLSNVVNGVSVTGQTLSSSGYINKNGRADKNPRNKNDIIGTNGNTATCPELTFKSYTADIENQNSHTPSEPYLLYACPNDCTDAPNGYSEPYYPRQTALVAAIIIQGTTYYYPVIMKDGIGRNKIYSIGLTITALGSTDPEIPVEKSSASFSVNVADWESGANYEETI